MSRPPDGLVDRILRRLERIPKGTALDTEQFPERDYPVQCLECGYALQGLPDGRCPECGRPFVRGELIVEIYARVMRPRRDARRRLSWALWLAGLTLITLWPIAVGVISAIRYANPDYFATIVSSILSLPFLIAIVGVKAGAFVCMWASILIDMFRLPPRRKRRAARRAVMSRSTTLC